MDLNDYRKEIDSIDKELVELFARRMNIAADIAGYKRENNIPVLDPQREREKLHQVGEMAGEKTGRYAELLYSHIFELSRTYQRELLNPDNHIKHTILDAVENTDKMFPTHALVACQGVEGAYSQLACDKLFKSPNIMYFSTFEGVFSAIDKGLCRYGVLPLENSTAGSVNKIYDLMMKYDFSIVRSTRRKVDHSLLVNKGVKLEDIKEIFSHEQAISQCESFLKTLRNVKITPCANTAAAAKMVFESGRKDAAALSSRSCAELYDLQCLQEAVQDQGNNHTRFICISKKCEIYPGADKTSIMMVLPHRPGALNNVLSRFYSLGVNLNKLESRPLPNSDFEFMFYFDLETSVYSEEFTQIFNDLDDICSQFKYLGSYTEVV